MRRRGTPIGRRGAMLLVLALLAAWAWLALGLEPGQLKPHAGGARLAREFFGAALRPAWTYEDGRLPHGAAPFPLHVAATLQRTVLFAAAALGLALPAGFLLGVVACGARRAHPQGRAANFTARAGTALQIGARVAIAVLRSVHELLWAVVFLAALGTQSTAAVLALAIPATGVLAKVFAELLDETPPDSADALRTLGASPLAAFACGTLPRALPDMAAYAFYRFECALRSAAVLGFFGFATLGHDLELAFDDLRFREVWSYLYALLALVLLLEAWSAALRRRVAQR